MRLDDALVILQTVWLRHIAILSPCDSMMHRAHITILSTCGAFYTSPCNHHSCDFDRDIMILMLKKRRQPPSMTTKDGRSYRNVPIPNETKIFARRSKHFRVIQWGSMHLPSLFTLYAPQTKILEGRTNISERVFEALFDVL
jgi:hypothetical protein